MAFFLAPGARIPGIPSRGELPGPRTGRGPPPERNPPLSVRRGRPGSRGLPPAVAPRELPPGTGSGVPGPGGRRRRAPLRRGALPPSGLPWVGGGLPPSSQPWEGGGPPPPQDGPGRGSAPAVDHPPGPTPGSPSRGRLGAPSRPPRPRPGTTPTTQTRRGGDMSSFLPIMTGCFSTSQFYPARRVCVFLCLPDRKPTLLLPGPPP